jgi:hypothetical protein
MSSNNANIKTAPSGSSNNSLFAMVMIGIGIIIIIFFIYSTYTGYTNYQKYSPYLINGITDATVAQTFPAHQISPSSDSAYGTEFTYSFWIFIKDTTFSATSTSTCSNGGTTSTPMQHVFHKGSYDYIPNGSSSNGSNGTAYPLLQMPGVWLYPNTNKLNIRFNTYENVVETSDIGNIPLNMWVNVIIILIGGSIDVYVNGNLKKRTKLNGVPKINYGNFYTTNWGGFQGYLSKLRYFNYAIQPFLVDQLFNAGPSTTFATNITSAITSPSAKLSSNYWMTTGYPNSANAPGYNQSSTTST